MVNHLIWVCCTHCRTGTVSVRLLDLKGCFPLFTRLFLFVAHLIVPKRESNVLKHSNQSVNKGKQTCKSSNRRETVPRRLIYNTVKYTYTSNIKTSTFLFKHGTYNILFTILKLLYFYLEYIKPYIKSRTPSVITILTAKSIGCFKI